VVQGDSAPTDANLMAPLYITLIDIFRMEPVVSPFLPQANVFVDIFSYRVSIL
jgi:hypothetical protein